MMMAWAWTAGLGSVLYTFQESTLPGKTIVVALVLASVGAWSVIVSRGAELRRLSRHSRKVVERFRESGSPLLLYVRRTPLPDCPATRLYESACRAMGAEAGQTGDQRPSGTERVSRLQFERVANIVDRNLADEALKLEQGMTLLASAVSASPFLGLLGTVWGVMDAFGAMARQGTAQLSAVAPGLAGALLTTVVGLLVALPSLLAYNILTGRIRAITVMLDNFCQELLAELQRTCVSG